MPLCLGIRPVGGVSTSLPSRPTMTKLRALRLGISNRSHVHAGAHSWLISNPGSVRPVQVVRVRPWIRAYRVSWSRSRRWLLPDALCLRSGPPQSPAQRGGGPTVPTEVRPLVRPAVRRAVSASLLTGGDSLQCALVLRFAWFPHGTVGVCYLSLCMPSVIHLTRDWPLPLCRARTCAGQ